MSKNQRFKCKYVNMKFEPFQKRIIYDSETEKEYDSSFKHQEELCILLNDFARDIDRLNRFKDDVSVLVDNMIEMADEYRTPISRIDYGDDIGYWNGAYQQLKKLKRMLNENQKITERFIFDHVVNREWKTPIVDTNGGKMNMGEVLDTLNDLSDELNEYKRKKIE